MCLGLNSWKSALNYAQSLLIRATLAVVFPAVAEKLFLW